MSKRSIKIMITNGRGGVGKTNLAYSLAMVLGQLGYNTVALDCDVSETLKRKLDKRRLWIENDEPNIAPIKFDFNTCVFPPNIKTLKNKTRELINARTASYDVAILDISGEFSAVQCNLAPLMDYIVMPIKAEETLLTSTLESYALIVNSLIDEESLDEADYPQISLARVMWEKSRLVTRELQKIIDEEQKEYGFKLLSNVTSFKDAPYAKSDYFGVSILEANKTGTSNDKNAGEKPAYEMMRVCKEILMDMGLADANMKKLK